MRSCTIDMPTDTELDLRCLSISNLLEDNYFATVPMISVRPAPTRSNENEEELYTSFEEAISGRVAQISRQLNSLPMLAHRSPVTSGTLVAVASSRAAYLQHFWRTRRRAITLACLGLSLLMAGFDLMGLLIIAR